MPGVWLDAAWVGPAWTEAPVPFDPSDRGLLLGDGLFDTALVLGGRMVWREAHVARLLAGCRALGIPLDPARVARALAAVLPRMDHGSLRITVTRGPAPRGLLPPASPHPTLLAVPSPLRAAALFAPLRLHVTAIRRNESSPLSGIKGLAYADNVLAAGEADRAGCDDAVLLNTRERVACTASANLFASIGGRLVTPPRTDGVLDGVARGVLLGLAATLGLDAVERSLALDDLLAADAVLATSSLRLVSPVVALGGRPIDGSRRLAAAAAAAVAGVVEAEVGIDPRRIA